MPSSFHSAPRIPTQQTTPKHSTNTPTSKIPATPSPISRLAPVQLANTTLHVSLNSNNYGAIPVSLKYCPTIDSFFTVALNAWELSDSSQVALLSVTFKWLPDEEPMVVTKTVPSSFESMLDVIDGAPCWGEGDEKKKRCDVRVKIIMK
jgi:hypothetical protein